MKQFLLFAGDNYYPEGGWSDFKSDHDTIEEATLAMKNLPEVGCCGDWWHIVDIDQGTIVAEGVSAAAQLNVDRVYAPMEPGRVGPVTAEDLRGLMQRIGHEVTLR